MASQEDYRRFVTDIKEALARQVNPTDDPFWQEAGLNPSVVDLDNEKFNWYVGPLSSKVLRGIATRHTKWVIDQEPVVVQAGSQEELRYSVRRLSDGLKLHLIYEPSSEGQWIKKVPPIVEAPASVS